MAQNITLLGASYSDVPAVTLPKTGGGTAKFTDVTPTTCSASDVASGKIFFDSSGNQQTGSASGGSVPYPTFDVTWSNDWSDIVSVTCDKTYQYCRDLYLNDADSRAVTIEHDQANTETYYLGASASMVYGNTDVNYVVSAGGIPELDINYHQNGTISFNYPSSQLIDVTPTATKGNISNASVSVTPSVSVPSSGGFVSGGTRTGSPVVVTASELVAGNTLYCDDAGSWDVTNAQTFVVAQGTAGTPTATKGSVSNHSVNITPSVTNTEGWIGGGTKTGTAVSVSASELVSGTLSVTTNGTHDVTNYASVNVNVSGGGGSTKNIQVNSGSASIRNNGYLATSISLEVAKTGTYKVSWTAWRSSSSGTMGTNLHVNSTTGTNNQTWTNTYGQHIVLNNQSYTAGDVLTLYATSGSSSRYCWVAGLTIEEQ